MIIRKSVHSLSAGEKATFVRALLELKRRGRYEEYVHWHHPDGSVGCSIRTSRRQLQEWRSQGPAFLPWHGGVFDAGRSGFAFDRATERSGVLPPSLLCRQGMDRLARVQKKNNPDCAPHYAPLRDGPPGHNLDDQLKPRTRAVRDVLDISASGYGYEPHPSQPSI